MLRHQLQYLVLLWTIAACATTRPRSPTIEAEAREFMTGYARDLLAGDRAAIAARYDERGAYVAGGGEQQLASPASLRSRYQSTRWTAPARFDWRDLSYEVIGPNAVLVSGKFDWTTAAGQTMPASYTALLVRHGNGLRIRAEHEDVAPTAMRAQLCAR